MSEILKEKSNSFLRIILLEKVALYLINQKEIMWSPLNSKLCDKRRNLSTTNDRPMVLKLGYTLRSMAADQHFST